MKTAKTIFKGMKVLGYALGWTGLISGIAAGLVTALMSKILLLQIISAIVILLMLCWFFGRYEELER